MDLNTEQKTAAEISSKHSLILAGPGTGKTTALVARYQHLLNQGIAPSSILCCTFARKASLASALSTKIALKAKIPKPVDSCSSFLL